MNELLDTIEISCSTDFEKRLNAFLEKHELYILN